MKIHNCLNIEKQYDNIANAFCQSRKKHISIDLAKLLANIKQSQSILDIGCGSGRIIPYLPKGINYTGLDISAKMIAQASHDFPDKNFIHFDASKNIADFITRKKDVISCIAVLHHLNQSQKIALLQNMHFALRKGGTLLISIWNLWHKRFIPTHFKQLGNKIYHKNINYLWVPFLQSNGYEAKVLDYRFCNATNLSQIRKLLKRYGFIVEDIGYYDNKAKKTSMFKGLNINIIAKKT